jgi:hypothetical protein
LLIAIVCVVSVAGAIGPWQRLVAGTFGQPSVVRLDVTLGDTTPAPVNLRPGQLLALYLRSPTRVGGFWLPSQVAREEILTPGVDYPGPLPSSPGFRERYDAFTAQSRGETNVRLQYVETNPATVPPSAPKDQDRNPSITLSVKVDGPELRRPSGLVLSCSGRSCSAAGFRVDITRVAAHHPATTPCLTSYILGRQPAPCTPYLETMITLAFHNGSVYDVSTGPSDFGVLPTGSGTPIALGRCSYVEGQPEPPHSGTFVVPPGASVSHYVFCVTEPPGGLSAKMRWRPDGATAAGELSL